MRGAARRASVVCACGALVAACATAPETPTASFPSRAGVYKIGAAYYEAGAWYRPEEQPAYDETGIASWYGPNFHGRRTANGEVFDAGGLTAAHPTLPMPVNVRVTNLENGRSLVLRVNDRGPFARGRIIDVSAHAAQLLGFYDKGTAKVRVTYLARADLPGAAAADTLPAIAATAVAVPTPAVQTAELDPVATAAPGKDDAAPSSPPPASLAPADIDQPPVADDDAGADAPAESPSTPAALDSQSASAPPAADNSTPQEAPRSPEVAALDLPPPAAPVATLPLSASTHLYVQVGAFSQRDNAERLRERVSAAGTVTISSIDRNGHLLYRVRIGPFDDVGAADAALAKLAGLGSSGAKILADR